MQAVCMKVVSSSSVAKFCGGAK